MTGQLTHGADPDRLEAIGEALRGLGERTSRIGTEGTGMLGTLQVCWAGPDLDGFARGWDGTHRHVQSAAEHLTRYATLLREQAAEQRGASGDQGAGSSGPGSPGGGDPGPTPSPTPAPTTPPPTEPSTDDPSPLPSPSPQAPPIPPSEDTINRMEDPGDETQVPRGVNADDPWVRDMMQTPEGRKTLQWLHDHGYEIDTSGSEGDKYYHSGRRIYLGPSWQNGGALIHEANHAEASVTGRTTTFGDTREDYVNGKIDEEVESNARQLEYGRQHGPPQPLQSTYDAAYNSARDEALLMGRSPADADAAGRAAGRAEIRSALESGALSPTGSSGNYRDYYGDQWDANQKPWYWPF